MGMATTEQKNHAVEKDNLLRAIERFRGAVTGDQPSSVTAGDLSLVDRAHAEYVRARHVNLGHKIASIRA